MLERSNVIAADAILKPNNVKVPSEHAVRLPKNLIMYCVSYIGFAVDAESSVHCTPTASECGYLSSEGQLLLRFVVQEDINALTSQCAN